MALLPGRRRPALRSPPFDPHWWIIVSLASLANDATVEEHVDNVPVIFIQHARDLENRELMVDEQVANGYLSLGFGVQIGGIRRKRKLLSNNRKSMVESGVLHQSFSFSGSCSGDVF